MRKRWNFWKRNEKGGREEDGRDGGESLYLFPVTRLELLIGFFILLFFGTIAVIGWNMNAQTPEDRNNQRQKDTERILDALYQYAVDHREQFPVMFLEEPQEICRTDSTDCADLLDLSDVVMYLPTSHLPIDPFATEERSTEYRAQKMPNGAIRISAPNAEMGEEIFAER